MPDLSSSPSQKTQNFQPLVSIIERAQNSYAEILREVHAGGGLRLDPYVRYLSMHYHLTSEVEQHFLLVVSHPSLVRRRRLRNFLNERAIDKASHFDLVKNDLRNLAADPLKIPVDGELWRAYFTPVAQSRPFARLGAAAVLENLPIQGNSFGLNMIQGATFLDRRNTSFIEKFFHTGTPLVAPTLQALRSVRLQKSEVADCLEGAAKGAILYLRMVAGVFLRDPLLQIFDLSDEQNPPESH